MTTTRTLPASAITDTLGVAVKVGDRVRIIHHGYAARLVDCGRVVTITGVTAYGNLIIDDAGAWGPDVTANGRAVRPGCVAVMRRDGAAGHEGNLHRP